MKEKIVFFGTEDFSASTLERLLSHGFNIEAVITKPDFRRGRGKSLQEPIVKKIAQSHNIPVLQPNDTTQMKLVLQPLVKSVGVLVSYGKIIPASIIGQFDHGIINLHPSLLPKYRGPAPIEATIINGDPSTGVSIMGLDQGMDSGPIYATHTLPLDGTEDAPALYSQLAVVGADLMVETLPLIVDKTLSPVSQDNTKATYTKLIKKDDGLLEPKKKTAEELERQVRAQLIYPKSFIQFNDTILIVKKAHISNHQEHTLAIKTSNNKYLVIDLITNKNGKLVTAKDYINHLNSSTKA